MSTNSLRLQADSTRNLPLKGEISYHWATRPLVHLPPLYSEEIKKNIQNINFYILNIFLISSYFLSPFFSKFSPISFSLIVSLSLIFTHTVFYSLTLSVSPRMTFVAKTIYQTFFFKHFIKYV